jgi:hypothetical protein
VSYKPHALFALYLNGKGRRGKRSNKATRSTAYFSLLFICNGMFWREGAKGTKRQKEEVKERNYGKTKKRKE